MHKSTMLRMLLTKEGPMVYVALYIIAAFLGLYVVAKWLGIIINLGFLMFMAVMLILVIALGLVSP